MASVFNGKFKLKHAENTVEFYKSIGASQEDISKYNFMDDSTKDIEIEFKIENEQYNKILFVGGRKVHETSYKLGVANDGSFEGVQYQIKVTLDGNKLIEWINRQGTKEHTYERTVDGDTMIEEMVSSGDVKAIKEWIRT